MIKKILQNGKTLEEFLSLVKEQEVIESINNTVEQFVQESIAFDEEMNLLIVAEEWCIDCLVNLPILKKLILDSAEVDYGIIDQQQYKEVFKTNKRIFIPLIIFYDKEFNEIGRWVETPYKMKEIRQLEDKKILEKEMREYRQGAYIEETIEELKKIVMPISK